MLVEQAKGVKVSTRFALAMSRHGRDIPPPVQESLCGNPSTYTVIQRKQTLLSHL